MKKFIFWMAAAAVCLASAGCENVNELWDAVDDLEDRVTAVETSVARANDDIAALQTLVGALQKQITIDSIVRSGDSCVIEFSDGTKLAVSAGGGLMPLISVKFEDGVGYWTVNGEFLLDDEGHKVRASANDGADGLQGESGADGVTPVIRVNGDTGEWEYSLDEGASWISTGVKASGEKGADGDSLFRSVVELDGEVVFTLEDGTSFSLPKTEAFSFVIVTDGGGAAFVEAGRTAEFAVEMSGVEDWLMASVTEGWSASFDGKKLTVGAPAEAGRGGEVAFMVTSVAGRSKIAKLALKSFEWRYLTFEDADYKGSEGSGYWSSLIDSPEYGGELLYGENPNDMFADVEYEWSDEKNTWLCSGTLVEYGFSYSFGGCAISDYVLADAKGVDFRNQLSIYSDSEKGKAGHNGSSNFCVVYTGMGMGMYPELTFTDWKEHVIDHMWVAVTAYTANSLLYVEGEKADADDLFGVRVTGFDLDDEPTGTVEFLLYGDGSLVGGWTKVELSALGAVSYVQFECTGSIENSWGLATPAYFAFDDVAVKF